jgi:predicted methyltransferase
MRIQLCIVALAACACATAPSTPQASIGSQYQSLVDAPDRTAADRALDPGRKPAAFLEVLAVKPGMQVGELFAGGGYTTELLARAVAPSGKVYAENTKWVLEKFGKGWDERLARPVNAAVVREDRELDAPFPPELAGALDLVVTNANYHDAVWLGVDRAKMNGAVFAALKPGGRYVVSDSSAKPGSGLSDVKTLHRIDEAAVRSEVEAAGFKLESSSDILRNPADTRDWSASPMAAGPKRGTSDRFILSFVKPG